jgi:hypothetical protein
MHRLIRLDGDVDVYLHTQPWSYRAIGIYLWAGFRFLKHGSFGPNPNQNEQAMPILREKMGRYFGP